MDHPKCRRGLPALVARTLVVATFAGLLVACGDAGKEGDAAFDRCMESFAQVAERREPGLGLKRALLRCEHIADWHVAAKAHPAALEGRDSVRVLAGLCASSLSEDLQQGRLCEQAFIVHPELEPAGRR
ncbi:MAG: hypothetical protein M3N28_08450 [Actinomycetota bacterium]|nr:hypothetical protein [Actinomycetota bacterium]